MAAVVPPALLVDGTVSVPGDVGLLVFFLVGLLGGAHCIGMCGPLVTLYADRMGQAGESDRPDRRDDRTDLRDVRQHALFNLGRTASYATIGAVMGALGALLFDAAAVLSLADGVRAAAGLGVGAFIVVIGAGYLLGGSVSTGSLPVVGDAFSRVYGLITGHVDRWVTGPRIVALGAVHGLLPCPILYPAFLYALATGSPVGGALSLAALGLGTFPTLFAYGTLLGQVDTRTRVRLHRALGVAFILLGYIPLSHGLLLVGIDLPSPHIPIYQPLG